MHSMNFCILLKEEFNFMGDSFQAIAGSVQLVKPSRITRIAVGGHLEIITAQIWHVDVRGTALLASPL